MDKFSRTGLRPLTLAVLAALALAGCASTAAIDREAPVAVPTDWQEAPARPTDEVIDPTWWRGFAVDELDRLIVQAFADNPDLAIASERVRQAEITLRNAGAALLPTVSVEAGTRTQEGNRNAVSADSSNAGVAVAYEIDLWGRQWAQRDASVAELRATRFDYDASRLALAASVAQLYFDGRALAARLDIARRNRDIAEQIFALVEAQYRAGAVSALDVSRQRAIVLAARDAVLPLEVRQRASVRALALVVGVVPQHFAVLGRGLDDVAVPQVAATLPATLLTRRPDIAAAEARLQAADANIAVARAAMFPLTLTLGVSAGWSSGEFGFVDLANPAALAGLGVNFLHAVFDGGRARGAVEISESQQRQLLHAYRSSALTALKEVDDALGEVTRATAQERTQREIRDEQQRILDLSTRRYRAGAEPLSTLLDAQRALFSAEDALLNERLARLTAAATLYKVLGGGWQGR